MLLTPTEIGITWPDGNNSSEPVTGVAPAVKLLGFTVSVMVAGVVRPVPPEGESVSHGYEAAGLTENDSAVVLSLLVQRREFVTVDPLASTVNVTGLGVHTTD